MSSQVLPRHTHIVDAPLEVELGDEAGLRDEHLSGELDHEVEKEKDLWGGGKGWGERGKEREGRGQQLHK